jgi:hypothetical protein
VFSVLQNLLGLVKKKTFFKKKLHTKGQAWEEVWKMKRLVPIHNSPTQSTAIGSCSALNE